MFVTTDSGASWPQKQQLLASDGGGSDQLGYSVAIYNDTIVAGARWDDDGGSDAGEGVGYCVVNYFSFPRSDFVLCIAATIPLFLSLFDYSMIYCFM